MANNTSPHILSSSVNLLGFCLVVITSLHVAQKTQNTMVDEFTSIVAVLLTFSSISSFVSLRTHNASREKIFERVAEALFFLSLTGIAAIISFIAISYWNKK